MFKNLFVISSSLLLVACASTPVSDNYSENVIIQKNNLETHTQIIGKEIVPIDLLETNLALRVSVLDVVANISNDSANPVNSIINFNINYSDSEAVSDEQQDYEKYDLVTLMQSQTTIESITASRNCEDETCTITQSFSFPITTMQLQNGQQHGVKFILQQTGNSEAQLETMIPGRYLTALFAN